MTHLQLQPTLIQTLINIAGDIPNFGTRNKAISATSIVSDLLAENEPSKAIKFAFSRVHTIEALSLLTYVFIRELSQDENDMLVLIGEVWLALKGQQLRRSTGVILNLSAQQRIDFIWQRIVGAKEEGRIYEILTDAAIATDDAALGEDLLVKHTPRLPSSKIGHLMNISMAA